jgi:hypothetical protein
MNGQLSPIVQDRVQADFPTQEREQIVSLLTQYGSDRPEAERVQVGILDLAKGQTDKVQTLVALAILDYRDVLNQAHYLNDPSSLLDILLLKLQQSGALNADEAAEVLPADERLTYRKAFAVLMTRVTEREKTLTQEQYRLIERMAQALNFPARSWKHLSKRVKPPRPQL